MQRQVMHMDLDSFFVSVERKLDPKLNGKPVLVGGGERGVVASCSYEARAFGIHSAMPMRKARLLCPEAIVVRGSHEQYGLHSDIVCGIIGETVPLYEKASIDEFYIEMTGLEKYFGSYLLAQKLRNRIISETGLPISFALSTGKTVAKIGTGQAKPNGHLHIPAGAEKPFLAPLHVSKIPMVGKKMQQRLHAMGIQTIGDLQQLTPDFLNHSFGDYGNVLWNKANGIDDSPVNPYHERQSISTETTFNHDVNDPDQLTRVLIGMTEKLAYRLRSEDFMTSCVAVKIRYPDFSTFTMQHQVPYTALDIPLIAAVKEVFNRLYRKNEPLRLIGVRFSRLLKGAWQFDLFDNNEPALKLHKAMDTLREKFGGEAVRRAAGLGY